MRFNKFIVFLFFPWIVLNAGDPSLDDSFNMEQITPMFDTEAAPNAIVGGVVNVISGRYFENETDFISPSANPIRIERSYNNGASSLGYLHGYWDLNVFGEIQLIRRNGQFFYRAQDRGENLLFGADNKEINFLIPDLLNNGICNNAPPKYAALASFKKRNYQNTKEGRILRNGFEKSLFGLKDVELFEKDNRYFILYLTNITFGSGCSHHYSHNNQYRVNRIRSIDSENSELAGINLIEHPPHNVTKERLFDLISDEGMKISYRLSPYQINDERSRYSVSSVETNFSPPIRYQYLTRKEDKPEFLTKKIYPDGRFLEVDYEDGRDKKRLVHKLKAPVGCDQKSIPIYTFEYDKKKAFVWDANGNKKIYYWKSNQRLNTIQHYDHYGKLYRSEEVRWGAYDGYKDPTHLRARHLSDAQGRFHMSKRFFNDEYGRVVREVLYGNLSGDGKLRNDIHDQSGQKYVKEYTYFGMLVASETIGVQGDKFQQRIKYDYCKGTDLIRMKWVSDQERVRERYYYEYAPCGVPVLEIVDDGSAKSIENLDGVTQRTVKRVKLTKKGLPCEEINAYVDLDTLNEMQLSRVVIHYTVRGKVERKDYYDANDNYAYSEEWKYNSYGQPIEEMDRAGRTTYYRYDANGNCLYKGIPHHEVETYYTYDYSNRLIKEEERHDDGRKYVKSYAYDLKGNRIKEVDPQGCETLYTYDEFDRIIERTVPSIIDENGELVGGSEKYKYDILDHLTEKVDADGKVTKLSTNYYGKPTRITHPDKTVEKAVYYYDGSLKYTIDSQKVMTWYEYDYKKRKVLEEKAKSNIKTWKYSAFNLIEEVDAEGIATTYSYDGAGRVTAKRRGQEETLYFYDALGREKEKWEKCGGGSYRVTVREYDIFGQVIEERVENESGELFLLKEFAYDSWGNIINETVYNQGEPSQTVSKYNSSGQLIKTIAPDGSETLFHYENDHINPFGQTVKTEIVIDPKGNVVYKVYDTRDKVAVEERKNVFSETVQRAELFYDQAGHLVLKKENVIVAGELLRVHATAFEYDNRGREIAVIEAKGEPEQKITRRSYTSFGEVEEILRPSGILLKHRYDSLGRLSSLASSDGSIDYAYTYDQNHNIVDVEDRVSHTHTSRAYDSCGNMTAETMAHGAVMQYAYDPLSRLVEATLSDNSTINYGYDAGYLREIHRGGYVHRDDYDLSGKRQSSQLAGSLGNISYVYDPCLRPMIVCSPYHGMELAFDRVGNVTEADYYDDRGEVAYRYDYDDLNQIIGDNFHTYQFDSLGNRVSYDGVESEHNALNQLLQQGDTHFQYDLNGNLSTKNGQKFTYDALDRMTEVIEGDAKTAYTYDPFHRRLKKTHYRFEDGDWVEVAKERYLYQSDKEIGVIDEHGALKQLRVLGVGVGGEVGAAVLMELGDRTYVPLHDWRGNVSALVDVQSKEVVESYRFDAFGVETAQAPINPWRFSSKRVDSETGFSYFGARYYDPEVGRWTTPDPLWFVDGTHLYCYVRNNPAMFIDPEGLFWEALGDFLCETFKAVGEFATNYVDVNMPENGTLQVNFGPEPFSFDHRSGIKGPADGVYKSKHAVTVNGINNSLEEALEFNRYFCGMAEGCSSSFVYNATHGAFWDLAESGLNLSGRTTRPEKLIHREWNNYFANCSEDREFLIHGAHSQGVILTRNALASYDPELRKKIHVIAIAPGAYIDGDLCGSVLHLVSRSDIVPLIDVCGRLRNGHTIKYLDPHPKAGFIDHRAKSETYKKEIEMRIKWIKSQYSK